MEHICSAQCDIIAENSELELYNSMDLTEKKSCKSPLLQPNSLNLCAMNELIAMFTFHLQPQLLQLGALIHKGLHSHSRWFSNMKEAQLEEREQVVSSVKRQSQLAPSFDN